MTDPVEAAIRRHAGNLLIGRAIGDGTLAEDATLALTDGLGLTPTQRAAVADRLIYLSSVSSVVVRALTPDRFQSELPRLIDHATDQLVARGGAS